ncbi:MAG TPA: VOC family protein [Bryobacteraceae bacterium]|nr:VOC family protein [Bryobacteraceae bacterium]
MITGIEHTAIAAADIVALAGWYVDMLGFEINYQSPNAIFIRAENGTMIEIIHAEGERPASGMKTPGIRHLALTVSDFDAAFVRLTARGLQFLTEPMESKGNRVVFFTDPEGNILHLLQRETPLPERL